LGDVANLYHTTDAVAARDGSRPRAIGAPRVDWHTVRLARSAEVARRMRWRYRSPVGSNRPWRRVRAATRL
jgi:hypothetical protein